MNFNEEQIQAIQAKYNTPILVLAGAGTGKTSVLTNRIIHLIENENVDAEKILAITFTNKAGNEIKKRVKLLGKDISWVGTFHSICLKILKQDISILRRTKDFKIIDSEDSLRIIKEIYQINNINKDKISYKNALNHIDKIKRKYSTLGFNNDVFEDYCFEEEKSKELISNKDDICKIWREYEDKMFSLNYLDFNDLLIFSHHILSNFPEKQSYWSSFFQYILVDEFQDTNDIQYELVSMLVNQNNNIFCVGDIDQTIYSFRGANPEIINKYVKDFSPETIILKQNYRSTQSILNVSNDLIKNNKNRIEKSLVSYDKNNIGIKPILYEAINEVAEASWIVKKIIELKTNGVNWKDICILVRNNHLTRSYEQELFLNDIPYKIYGGIRFYERKEIKDIIAYLNAIYSYDELSLKRIINTPSRKIGLTTIDKLTNLSNYKKIPFIEILRNLNDTELSSSTIKSINLFLELIETWKNFQCESIIELIDKILLDIDYFRYLQKEDESKLNSAKENISELKKSILSFESEHKDSENILQDYLHSISLMNSVLENENETNDEVKIMTIHNAKGLEFDNVFLVSFNQNIFPSYYSISEPNGLEEERRIAYVAMTRPKKKLFISYNKDFDFRTNQKKEKSQFLNEINSNLIETYTQKMYLQSDIKDEWFDSYDKPEPIKIEQQYNDEIKICEFSKGDIISHITFGQGTIIEIDQDGYLTIDFKKPIGLKKILHNHKSINRVFK